jgi:O-antigen/teichoic acid export membrane protein
MAVAITFLDLAYIGIVWIFREWLIGDLLHKNIPDRDRLLLLWAAMALVFLPREILQAGLYALRQLKSMAWMVAVSAMISLAIMWFGPQRWGAAIVLIGQLGGECVNLAGLSWLLWVNVRRRRLAEAAQN